MFGQFCNKHADCPSRPKQPRRHFFNNKEKSNKIVNDVLSPVLGRPTNELERLLLFGSVDECIKKIKAFLEAGVNNIHFWPINNYIEQIELFSKEIIHSFR